MHKERITNPYRTIQLTKKVWTREFAYKLLVLSIDSMLNLMGKILRCHYRAVMVVVNKITLAWPQNF